MKLDKKANSNNDEFYTPKYAVTPIVEHLKKRQYKNIWSPFDMEHSLYVKVLRQEGFNVTPTHINDGKNFFDYGGLFSRVCLKVKKDLRCSEIISLKSYI